jgi:hypothetical protein
MTGWILVAMFTGGLVAERFPDRVSCESAAILLARSGEPAECVTPDRWRSYLATSLILR